MYSQLHEMVLRADRPTDESTLRRLAALDSARPIRGRALVAEVDGRAVAAIGLTDGRVVADPFVKTSEVVELLQVRADRMQPEADERPHGLVDRFRAAVAA
ncbi:MAG: hypothetical protein WKF96_08275 [Solirubrobacteraceae bacterium]